jgi:hypothetical protein
MSMKNSNNTIGNRTRDRATCGAVPQPTAPPASCPRFNSRVLYYPGTYMLFGNNESPSFFKSHVVVKLADLSVPFFCSSCGNTCQEPPIYALFCHDFYSFRTSVLTFSLTENQDLYRGRKGLFLWAGKMVRMVRYWK